LFAFGSTSIDQGAQAASQLIFAQRRTTPLRARDEATLNIPAIPSQLAKRGAIMLTVINAIHEQFGKAALLGTCSRGYR
jgi:hypothetical protein